MDFDFRSGLFPWTIGGVLMALALVQLGMHLVGVNNRRSESNPASAAAELPRREAYLRTVKICGWNIGYCVAVWLLGFSLSIALMTFLYLKLDAREKWPITVALTSGAWLFFYALFDYLLNVPFPAGLLFSRSVGDLVGSPAVKSL
jgi:hypothetical protein